MTNPNIYQVYQLMEYIVRKSVGSFVTVEEAMQALDAGQIELFNEAFKQYQINQNIVDTLSPFKVKVQFLSDSDGQVTMPSDYQHLLGSIYTVYGSTVNSVHFVNEDELPDRLTSQLRPVALSTPIAIDSALGFQLFPNAVQTGFYTYLRRPATPVLSYTYVNRVFTYIPGTSTQLEFYDIYAYNIIARAMKYVGVNLSEQEVQQFAQSQQLQTN